MHPRTPHHSPLHRHCHRPHWLYLRCPSSSQLQRLSAYRALHPNQKTEKISHWCPNCLWCTVSSGKEGGTGLLSASNDKKCKKDVVVKMVGAIRYYTTEIKKEKKRCRLVFFFSFFNLIQCMHTYGTLSHISKTTISNAPPYLCMVRASSPFPC